MGSVKRLLPVGAALLLKLGITAAFYWYPARQLLETARSSGNTTGLYFTLVLDLFLFLLTLFHFGTASTIDPGIIPRTTDDDEDSSLAPLYRTVVIRDVNVQMKWCTTCKFYRPPRSSHCSVCDSCVQNFDHHCPWLGNCIGRRNYRFFYWYLCSLTAHMVITFSCSIVFIFNTRDLPTQTNIIISKWSTAPVIASIVICVLVFIFFFFVFGLMAFHTFLITNGRSTYEQFSNRYQHQTPFDFGIKSNWIKTFCAPIPPSLMPPEPYIEINPTSQGQKYHASNNYHGSQFKVTIKNQQNNSQRIRLLQENEDSLSIGACSMNGDLVSDKENGHAGNNRADSLANMPLSLSASIQNLTQKTKESGLVCTLPQDDSTLIDESNEEQITSHQQHNNYEQIKTHDTIVKVKHTDF